MTEQKEETQTAPAPAAAAPAPQTFKILVGVKVGMTQFFDDHGSVVPCTVVRAGPCRVTQIRTTEKDGYQAVQIGFNDIEEKKVSKPVLGQFKKAGLSPLRWLKEFRVASVDGFS